MNNSITCAVIGDDLLTLKCLERLLEQNFRVEGVISAHAGVIDLAKTRQTPYSGSLDLLSICPPIDYIFSIANPRILPSSVLGIPSKLAVNYHNGPLPKYGGAHANAWAILNGEKEHGVTWHVMTEGIDEGDILNQIKFKISEDDTALSLNIKCFEHALVAFDSLLSSILEGAEKKAPQSSQEKSYFPKHKKPWGNGLLNFDMPAEEIERVFRALDFGSKPNQFCIPKILIDNKLYYPKKIRLSKDLSDADAGTILGIVGTEILVSTKTHNVFLSEISCDDAVFFDPTNMHSLVGKSIAVSESEASLVRSVAESASKKEAFWLKRLVRCEPLEMSWATKHPTLSSRSETKETLSIELNETIAYAFGDSVNQTYSSSEILLSAMAVFLQRCSRQNNFSLGFRIKQSTPGLREILPFEVDLSSTANFADLLKKIHSEWELIHSRCLCPSDLHLRHTSLANHVFTFIVEPLKKGLKIEAGLPGLEPRFMRVIESSLQQMAASALRSPLAPLESLKLLSEEDSQKILLNWSHAQLESATKPNVYQQFRTIEKKCPEAIAIEDGDTTLTYEQLLKRSQEIAARLKSLNVKPGAIVGICLKRSSDLIASILSTMEIGAAFLLIEPELSDERKKFLIDDARLDLVITNTSLASDLKIPTCFVDSEPGYPPQKDLKFVLEPMLDSAAYVLYTSGTTGMPKGALVKHSALSNTLANYVEQLEITPGKRVLSAISQSFDPCVLEILSPLTAGATVVLAENGLKDIDAILEKLKFIDLFIATPSFWRALINRGWKGNRNLKAISGGEHLTSELAESLLPCVNTLWNLYGPTETTIYSTAKRITTPSAPITVGRPISNTTCYILDPFLHPVPVGVPGELHIGGMGLAVGYLNRPELTAEKFIPSPFPNSMSDRLYKTGDLARWTHDGEIEILGRIDEQVKIRGYRIELGEIEAQLKLCAGVQDAVVLAREDTPGNKRLVAYVIGEATREVLKQHIARVLPDYMMPSAFVFMQAFPLNHSGKLDRKALPVPDDVAMFDGHEFVAPRSPIEQQIAEVWAETLGLEKISVTANFFEIGGHSLLAVQLMTRLGRIFNIDLPLRLLFERPRVADLASHTEQLLQGGEGTPLPKLVHVDRSQPIPLSYSQRRLWFLDQLEKKSAFYNVPIRLELEGDLNFTLLRQCFRQLIDRHEALRTLIGDHEGEPVQVILPRAPIRFERVGLEGRSKSLEEAERLSQQEAQKAFDLAKGPLIRAKLLRLNASRHWLLITLHHIVSDGWSINLLMRELIELYNASLAKREAHLPPISLHYADFSVWQQRMLESGVKQEQLQWWQNQLQDAPPFLNLPNDFPRPQIQTYQGKTHVLRLSSELVHRVRELAESKQTTPFVVFLAAFGVLLGRYSGQDDLVVGTPVAGRTHGDAEHLIGCFINTLALRVDLKNTPAFSELVDRVKTLVLGALAHQDLPFEELIEHLKLERDLSHSPLFQVMFNYLSGFTNEYQLGDVKATLNTVDRGMAHFDLSLTIQDSGHEWFAHFEYNTSLFATSSIERMAGHFINILQHITEAPNTPVHKARLLSTGERHELLEKWSGCEMPYSGASPLHCVFEEQARRTPDKVALAFGSNTLSFAELDQKAGKLASELRRRGIGRGTRVAICLERSMEFIIAVLGVMKSGATYVPIDPEIREDRLRYILDDTGAPFVITHSNLNSLLCLFDLECIYVDWVALAVDDAPFESVDSNPDDLAYIIYTSGSTGEPKGVPISHASIADRVHWKATHYDLDPNHDVMLHAYSFVFDGSVINYFWPLCYGMKLVIASSSERRDSREMIRLINQHEVTTVDLLPSLLHAILEESEVESCVSLQNVFSGGEALSGEVVQLFFARLNARLHNTYGPTEATVEASVWECGPDFDGAIAPIGRPIADAKLYVLDRYLQPLPIGIPGELHIGGNSLTPGYVNKPELTALKFVDDPFTNMPGAKLYKTGDLVKYRPDGNIDFIGRFDNQVKIRGFRIELSEIESALTKLDEVHEALVIAREDRMKQKYITAYVVPAHGQGVIDEGLLREHCIERLPAYMVPRTFAVLDSFPTLLNGKIDLQGLPVPDEGVAIDRKMSEPQNETESKLYRIWIELLNLDRISTNDNFFDVGGHSLLAVRLMSRIRNEFGVDLPLASLFQHPSVASMAHLLDAGKKMEWSALVPIQPKGRRKPLFLVHPVGGNVLCYQAFGDALGRQQPLFALQARGLEEEQTPHSRIEDIAAEYVAALRQMRPKGPYTLGGWSFGGLVAVEMAHQLEQAGQRVERVVLIDSIANLNAVHDLNLDDDTLFLKTISRELGVPLKDDRAITANEIANFLESGEFASSQYSHGYASRLVELVKANYVALKRYQLPNVKSPLLVIKAQTTVSQHPNFGWEKFAAKIDEIALPGDHWSIVRRPDVDDLVRIIKTYLSGPTL